jgi:hypothetical protein
MMTASNYCYKHKRETGWGRFRCSHCGHVARCSECADEHYANCLKRKVVMGRWR